MNEPTIDKLHKLRLAAMAEAWNEQNKSPKVADLGFDERFAMLVDAEYLARDNRRLTRLLKDAQLRLNNACVEDIETSPTRGLDKATLRQLGACGWLKEHLNVLLSGPTGVGKSYVACAFAHAACRKGHRVLYRRVPRLLDELALARADGTYARLLARLVKIELLVLDDWGLGSLKEPQRHDLLEVLEDRYGRLSTIVTSQLPIAKWHEWIGDPTLADAILDRLVNNAYKVDLRGHSRRKEKNDKTSDDTN
jgi:DNA replication protein DnaC